MHRAVIFDLDGTLVDHLGAQSAALWTSLRRLGSGDMAGDDGLLARWRQLERRHMDEYLAGQCTFAERRRRRLRAFWPLISISSEPDDESVDAWWAAYADDYAAAWTIYPDVAPCLNALKGHSPGLRFGVLTNGDSLQQRAKLARFDLLERMAGVYVSSEIGVAKPDAASFQIACARLGVEPREAVFVGDWLEVDALAAEAAGLTGIWLDRFSSGIESSCPRIASLAELPALVLGPGFAAG